MAGISIRLEKLIKDESYISNFTGYLITTFAVAGPWIITIIVLSIFSSLFSAELRVSADFQLFNATVVYGFIGSQLITVPFQFIVTRYIADEIYRNRTDFLRATFTGMLKVIFVIGAILSGFLFFRSDLPLYYQVLASYFLIMVSFVWISSFFISALGDYTYLGKSFIVGSIVGFVTFALVSQISYLFSYSVTITGLLMMVSSMTTIFIMICYKFMTSIDKSNQCQFDFIRSFSNYSSLFYIGVFYILGLWIDKFLMWGSKISLNVLDVLYVAPAYDQASFLSNLLIIPSNVLFLSLVEVEFIKFYKDYFKKTADGTYIEIERARILMKKELLRKILQIFIIQSVIVMFIYVFTYDIFSILKYDVLSKMIFTNLLPGLTFYIFVLLSIIMFLYFEERMKALFTSLGFFIANLSFTLFYINQGHESYGKGFTIASIVVSIYALFALISMLNNVNYRLFGVKTVTTKKRKKYFETIADNLRIKKGVELDE
ncbi:exopolysaccharide Pel transporter PelG [Mycoplasmatota bacterium WC44]